MLSDKEEKELNQQLAAEQERYDGLQRSVMDLSHPNCKGLLNERNEARRQLDAEREKRKAAEAAVFTARMLDERQVAEAVAASYDSKGCACQTGGEMTYDQANSILYTLYAIVFLVGILLFKR